LAIDVDGRIRSARVIEVLSHLVSARGAPRFLRTDRLQSSTELSGRRAGRG
jgi:putative transposase